MFFDDLRCQVRRGPNYGAAKGFLSNDTSKTKVTQLYLRQTEKQKVLIRLSKTVCVLGYHVGKKV